MAVKQVETADRVEFRWRQHEEEFAQRLAESAAEAGRSSSDQARELLKNALTASDELRYAIESLREEIVQVSHQLRDLRTIKDGLRTVHENIYQFRDAAATCMVKLLVDVGGLQPKVAVEWARKSLDAE